MSGSSYAEAARAKKVTAYVRYFDGIFLEIGYDLHKDAAELAAWLLKVSAENWKLHAINAGQHKPSADTVALIIKAYEDRAAAHAREFAGSLRRYGGMH